MSEKAVSWTRNVLIIFGIALTVAAGWAFITEYKIITDALKKITGRGFALWIWGFWVSLFLGHFGTKWAMWVYLLRAPEEKGSIYLPAWMMGTTERFIFTLLIASTDLGTGVVAAMAGWVSIKMATGWAKASKPETDKEEFTRWKATALSSLCGNLVSMSFAVLGGSICHLA